jgi:DNA-directed RNA polymerase specialized sigma24 family protein
MMTNQNFSAIEYTSDAELVSRTLSGDQGAFNRIVSRYQILICSLAYSRLGHFGQSEHLAQETFITAWIHLRLLREPQELRAWLCGIVRNRCMKCLKREGRQAVNDADALQSSADLPSPAVGYVRNSDHSAQCEESFSSNRASAAGNS